MQKGKMASFVFQRINNVIHFERKPTFGCREKERKGKENKIFENLPFSGTPKSKHPLIAADITFPVFSFISVALRIQEPPQALWGDGCGGGGGALEKAGGLLLDPFDGGARRQEEEPLGSGAEEEGGAGGGGPRVEQIRVGGAVWLFV